ncbi:MAG: hypothetical protein KatS3mg055_2547 [Chloroflexus sp.]|nr:MAG: hypothetical protein KatS3mg055_2547 [Chloroflexus sp.]
MGGRHVGATRRVAPTMGDAPHRPGAHRHAVRGVGARYGMYVGARHAVPQRGVTLLWGGETAWGDGM